MDEQFTARFAAEWIDAWNSHDIERVLAHYTEDFEMTSPFIARLAGEPSGTLRGKAAVGKYWRHALTMIPDLKFELIAILTGVNSITLHYKGAQDRLAAEVFHFDPSGKVVRAFAHYG